MRTQEVRGRLVHALRQAGVTTNPQALADAICTLINQKIATSEGKHHARFHKKGAIPCQKCNGRGTILIQGDTVRADIQCPRCQGSGKQ